MKKTSLPSTPVFQPITASFTPTLSPLYQPISVESVQGERREPDDPVARRPRCPGRRGRAGAGDARGSFGSAKKSGCTVRSMGLRPVGSPVALRRTCVPAAAAAGMTRTGKRSRLPPMAQPATRPETLGRRCPLARPLGGRARVPPRAGAPPRAQPAAKRHAQLERALLGRARRAHLPDRRLLADGLARDPDDVRDLTRPSAILGAWRHAQRTGVIVRRGDGRPLVIGHRGAAAVAPENTIEALAAGRRGRRRRGGVRRRRRACCSGTTPHRATGLHLDDALAFLRDTAIGVQVDMKAPRDRARRRRARPRARARGADAHLVEPHRSASRILAEEAPEVQRGDRLPGGSLRRREDAVAARRVAAGAAAARQAMRVRAPLLLAPLARPSVLALHKGLVSAAVVRAVHARGGTVLTWTVNDPALVTRAERGAASTRSARTIPAWCSPSSRRARRRSQQDSSARRATLIVAREAPPFHRFVAARPRRCRRRSRASRPRSPARRTGSKSVPARRSRRRTAARRRRSRCTRWSRCRRASGSPACASATSCRRAPRRSCRRPSTSRCRCRSTSSACSSIPRKLAKPYVDRRGRARPRGEARARTSRSS